MKKLVSAMSCVLVTGSLLASAAIPASAASSTAVDPKWQYKTMVDFEELSSGFVFGSKDDVAYSLYLNGASGYAAKVGEGGYKKSNTFNIYSAGTKSVYAQPLVNVSGFTEKNIEFEGATEFWMWVDFSGIKFDEVGMQFRLIEGDFNPDGTPAADQMSQLTPAAGKPIYIQSSPTAWKSIKVSEEDKLPLEKMEGYKGFVRIPISSFQISDFGTDLDGKINLNNVFQVWMIFNFPNNDNKEYLALDQFMFVGPSLTDGKAISKISFTDTNQSGGSASTTKSGKTTTAATKSSTTAATEASTTAASESTTAAEATTTQTTQAPTDDDVTTKTDSGSMVWLYIVIAAVVLAGGTALWFLVIRKKLKKS